MKDFGKYRIIGETRDDAAGECFDKTARILGLSYPGGPAIAAAATKQRNKSTGVYSLRLPRPMLKQKNYDFSFSGLKTAVLYNYQGKNVKAMAREIQQAIIDVLISKTLKAARDFKAKTIILGGGVAANEELRKQFKSASARLNLRHLLPPKNLCTDNAAMVAAAAYLHPSKGPIEADANLRI